MDLQLIGAALLEPFADPGSRTWWGGLVVAAAVALVVHASRGEVSPSRAVAVLLHRSSRLDLQLFLGRQLLRALGWLPVLGGGWWLATRLVRGLDGVLGAPVLGWSNAAVTAAYTLVLFVAWDLSRYLVHRLMHEVPALWAFHQVHHSAEVLTPLTFHRIHPAESLLYGLRGLVVTGLVSGAFFWLFRGQATEWTLLGVHGVGFVANVLTGNLRHSHAWLRFGPLERVLVSPAQHQLHHALGGDRVNFGTWLAVWDRLGGSWAPAGARPPARFGLRAEDRNHGDDLVSAWWGPLRQLVGKPQVAWRPLARLVLVASLGLLLPGPAHGDGPAEAEPGDDEDGADIDIEIVVTDGGAPRVAGSAYVLDEAALEQFEYDDIHQVLGQVPGIYVRDEDGFGLRPNIGLRGGNADRSAKVTLLEDGVPFAPAPYAAPAAYYFPLVTRMVGVEVFKGAASIQHGPQTIGGAINLKTRPIPDGWRAAVDAALGLRGTHKVHTWAGGGGRHAGILIEGVGLGSSGFKQLDGGGDTGFDRRELMLKVQVRTDPRSRVHTGLELKAGYAEEQSNETYLGLSGEDFAETPYRRYAASQLGRMRWRRTQLQVAWPLVLGDVQLRTVAYHHGLDRAWRKLNRFADGPNLHSVLQSPEGERAVFLAILRGDEDSTSPAQRLQIGTNDRQFASTGVQSRLRWRADVPGVTSRFEAGVRLHHDRVRRLHTEDPHDMRSGRLVPAEAPELTLLDSDTRATALAAYVHEDLELGGRVHLVPGLRVESIGTQVVGVTDIARTTVVLPGLGLLADLTPGVAALAGIHRGFSPVSISGSGALAEPETSTNVEAGLRVGQAGSRAEVVGFFNDYANLTAQCTFSGGCSDAQVAQQFDAGRAWVYGVEALVAHTFLLPRQLSVPLELSYTRTEGQFRRRFDSTFSQWGSVNVGDGLPYVPRDQSSLQLSLAHPRFRVGAALRHRGAMLDAAAPWPADSRTDVPALTTLDVAVDVAVTDAVTAYAVGTNLTGAAPPVSWRPFGARPPAPLQVMVGIKVASP